MNTDSHNADASLASGISHRDNTPRAPWARRHILQEFLGDAGGADRSDGARMRMLACDANPLQLEIAMGGECSGCDHPGEIALDDRRTLFGTTEG